MAHGYTLRAEYEDGFILDEAKQHDQSAFIPMELIDGIPSGPNTWNDIKERRPEAEHGRMVRFSALNDGTRPGPDGLCQDYHIDWRGFPDNAKPIKAIKLNRRGVMGYGWVEEPNVERWLFGYEYHNADGSKVKEILEI